MKKLILGLAAAAAIFALTACGTTSQASKQKEESKISKALKELEAVSLKEGEIWSYYIEDPAENAYSANAFYAASAFMGIDEYMNFGPELDSEARQIFAKELFTNLPSVDAGENLKIVATGAKLKGMKSSDKVAFVISTVNLKAGAVPGHDKAYMILSNVGRFKTTDKKTGETSYVVTGTTFSTYLNYYILAVPYENGVFVTAGNLNLGKQNYSADMGYVDKGNLMDTFCKDEIAENDQQIEAIYKEITGAQEAATMTKKALAPLNYGLYLAKKGDLAGAKKLWNSIDINSLPQETDNDKNTVESLKTVFSRDIPNLTTVIEGLSK